MIVCCGGCGDFVTVEYGDDHVCKKCLDKLLQSEQSWKDDQKIIEAINKIKREG